MNKENNSNDEDDANSNNQVVETGKNDKRVANHQQYRSEIKLAISTDN